MIRPDYIDPAIALPFALVAVLVYVYLGRRARRR